MTQRELPPSVLQWLYRVLDPEYQDGTRTYNDTASTLTQYPSLRPRTAVYTDENGRSELLLCLFGTVPAYFGQSLYRIPVEMWVPKSYPLSPPVVFVRPTDDMITHPGNHVDTNGRVYHPYLSYWDHTHGLSQLVEILSDVFSKEPPVYSKPPAYREAQGHQASSGSLANGQNGSRLTPGLNGTQPLPSQGPVQPIPNQAPNQAPSHGSDQAGPSHGAPKLPPKPPGLSSELPRYSADRSSRESSPLTYPESPMTTHPPLHDRSPVPDRYGSSRNSIVAGPSSGPYGSRGSSGLDSPVTPVTGYHSPYGLPGPPGPPAPQAPPGAVIVPQVTRPAPLDIMDMVDRRPNSTASPPPPPPPNPERMQTIERFDHALQSASQALQNEREMDDRALHHTEEVLSWIEREVKDEKTRLENLSRMCDENEAILIERTASAKVLIDQTKTRSSPNIDDVLTAENVAFNQLYDLVAEDNAIDDTVYVLGKALDRNHIALDEFLKHVRRLSREQFLKRALVQKIANQAGLDRGIYQVK